MTDDPPLAAGWVDASLAAEFPELALVTTEVAGSGGRTPRSVKEQLRQLSNRFTGARAVMLRQEQVPWAYRVFFRHVGIDPDERRTPIEQLALDRLKHGGFKSHGRVEDALLIATLETAVPVVAFDADRIDGELGLRLTAAGELLGGSGRSLAGGQLAIADRACVVQVLFGDAADRVWPDRDTSRIALGALRVKGVPGVSVEEALWMAAELLQNEPSSE
jgi:DNA/RNA-binding domain of Phe-tRNA-synthetase-like protein